MIPKKSILMLFLLLLPGINSFSQVKSRFSGEADKFREEVSSYLGPNLTPELSGRVTEFFAGWDSSAYSGQNRTNIMAVSSSIAARNMRPIPHFTDFLQTLIDFSNSGKPEGYLSSWLTGLSKMILKQSYSNDYIDRHFRNTSSTLKNNIIYESGNIKWKVKGNNITFGYDSTFKISLKNVTLTAYSFKDSTEIYDVTGVYHSENTTFYGSAGIVTWMKAGYKREDVFATINDFIINTQKSSFTVDSARLTHKTYFREPVYGKLIDQASGFSTPERAIYPKFETYTQTFTIKDLYKGVNYEGGLTLDGASVKGTGPNIRPARISLFRNDTLYIKVSSVSFLITAAGINSQESSATLLLGNDSIFHSSVGFSYNASTRVVDLFRNNNPVSKSPFYNSFHSLDMYFENLSWNMNESKVFLTRARGAAMGQARFESLSFFTKNLFERLAGIDDYHPLFRLKQFSQYFYSNTFPVSEFARWVDRPEDAVTGLCIDLANRGFLFYDRTNNEVTIKKKVDDYIAANSSKIDYDVMSIFSETNAPLDNAWLDLKSYLLTVNGVPGVFLSDSQRVAIYPYNNQVVIGKNRSLNFDGVVEAGLFTIFGHNFSFSYDTFKIRLEKIDSIRIAVETDKKDRFGNYLAEDVDNLIQLTTAELYIDDPRNKSGMRSLQQYPIINAVTYSYIFFDRLPGIEDIYKKEDFFFRIDPFTYENIDHYRNADMSLGGEFFGGKILEPGRQFLTIQEDNSLGFRMNIPEQGLSIYEGKGLMYNEIVLNNKGLVGSGTLKRLTSTTESEEYRFFPDSMITSATVFNIATDTTGRFPELKSTETNIRWLTTTDEWFAENKKEKPFEMFANGTRFDGSVNLTPSVLKGSGITDMADSRILSENFRFTQNTITADTSDYNLKTPQGDGFAFIAENVNASIDFMMRQSRFSLNTDSSIVKFPEIQYICAMTDFIYDMDTQVLSMEQRGRVSSTLMPAGELLKIRFNSLEKPTFISTNNLNDTIKFSSGMASYHLKEEFIEADNVNYLHIADALIQPDSGRLIIDKRARLRPFTNALIAVNNRHILHSANITIENSKRYSGSAVYNYVSENNDIQPISFPVITVDTATTTAKGFISPEQKFMLSPAFTFAGDVSLSAREDFLYYIGSSAPVHNCKITSYPMKFRGLVNPGMVMIPLVEKPRDVNDNLIFSGSFLNIDSAHIYPAFFSERKSYSDAQFVIPEGFVYFEKETGRYKIASRAKLADPTLAGPLVTFDKNYCVLSGEGPLNFGTNFDLVTMKSAGKIIHSMDSNKVNIEALIALDFHFSPEALQIMSDEIRMIPTLPAVNLNSDLNRKGMKDLLGESSASQINEELGLFGTLRTMPKEYTFELLLNDVKLYWNEATASFRSRGKVGIGFVGQQPVNVYVDGLVEMQRRRSGDMIDIYLKADRNTWYYFSYVRGVLMTQSSSDKYNNLIVSTKEKDRKDPRSSIRNPYSYMISVEGRVQRFLRRMESDQVAGEEPDRE